MRLIDFFDQAAARHPERCAFADRDTTFDYAQMRAFSQRLAAAMRERGISDNARVAIYSPNSAAAFGCILAIVRVGAVYVPINVRNALHENAGLHTGDIAQMDGDGFLYIVDRKRDMIISGGFNVYSVEVEAIVNGHPAVEICAVVGVPDSKWGEAVKAAVVLKPHANASEQEIFEFCKAVLGSVKAPKSVEFWSELPRTPVGKVEKSEIRARYWAGRQRAVN